MDTRRTLPSPNMPTDASRERSTAVLSAALFLGTVLWGLERSRRERARHHGGPAGARQSLRSDAPPGTVGSRAARTLSPPPDHQQAFIRCMRDPCHRTSNPTGHIALCIAENKLVTDLLAERLAQPNTASTAFSDPTVYSYNSFLGIAVARQAVAYFLAKRFLFADTPSNNMSPHQALEHVSPSNVCLAAGGNAILNSLFFLLGEKGDVCLVPTPYYAAFDNAMSLVAEVLPFGFDTADPAKGPTADELEAAYAQATALGYKPKFLLLTNPNNPTGAIYSALVIKDAIQWCRTKNLHTIVDECYALSVHRPGKSKYHSVIKALDNNLGDDVHMIWSLSKDFGASGFRIGVLYSQNRRLMQSLANMNIFSAASAPMQMVVSELLTDDAFVDEYLKEYRSRLFQSYNICANKLREMVVPFIAAEAGMFVYIDLRSIMPKPTIEWEAKLAKLIEEHARIVLSSGSCQHDRTPGMFRLCYAWNSPEVLQIAMERLSRLVSKARKLDWSDIDNVALSGVM